MKNLPDWVSHISALDLPVLRRTLVELARLGADQDHATAKDIAEIVSHDPFMTIKILRTVNQRRSRHFDTEITTLEHAVMMLGIPPFFRAFARLRALEDVLRDKPEQLQGLLRRLSRSRHAGFQARGVSVQRRSLILAREGRWRGASLPVRSLACPGDHP